MITTVAEFVAENNKRKQKGLPTLNENNMDIDSFNDDGVQETEFNDDETEFNDNEEELTDDPIVTLDTFKEALSTKFNEYMENLEEGAEEPEMLTEIQMGLAFDAYQSLLEEPVQDVQVDDMDVQDDEEIEEAFGFGPSKEEIEAGRKGAEERLKQLEANFSGKTLTYMEKGDNKQMNYSFEAMMKLAEKNKFRGVIKSINKGDKVVFIYEPGKTLLQKMASGASANTVGA